MMDKAKIDNAVRVMQALTIEERAAVNYTVEREGKKRIRRTKEQIQTDSAQQTLAE
jgi:hypothetical protein